MVAYKRRLIFELVVLVYVSLVYCDYYSRAHIVIPSNDIQCMVFLDSILLNFHLQKLLTLIKIWPLLEAVS